MTRSQKFFELISPNINIDFVGRQRLWVRISLVAVVLSIAILIANVFLPGRGLPLNWGVDFRGGSQVLVDVSKNVEPEEIRSALEGAGHGNAEVVRFETGRGESYMIRMGSVSVMSNAEAEKAKAALSNVQGSSLTGRGFEWSEGGDKIYLRFDKHLDPSAVESAVKAAGVNATMVRQFGAPEQNAYEVTLIGLDSEIKKAIEARTGAGTVTIKGVSSVGAKAGKQLRIDGLKALMGAVVLIMIYVSVRFDVRYAPSSMIGLLHDAIIMIGVLAVTYREVSLTTLAALLTIVGFSINDKIVVFDRIREISARSQGAEFRRSVNVALNQTLSRTIITNSTVFFVTLAMNIFAVGVIEEFAFAMNIGVVVSTFSSIFIATPAVIWLNDRYLRSQKKQQGRPERSRRVRPQDEEPVET